MNMLRSLIVAALLALGLATPAYSQCAGQFPNNTFCGYTGGSPKGLPVPVVITPGTLDPIAGGTVIGNPTGVSAIPQATATPVLGVPGSTLGQIGFAGSASGTVTIRPQTAAGTPTLTLPNTSGTIPSNVTAPLALGATTGQISITGAAGQVLAGATPAFTAAPVLGVPGSQTGSVTFANATSGTVTIQSVSGALGSSVLSLPAAIDTLVGKATTDTLTNKTIDTAATGNIFKINGNTVNAVTGNGSTVALKTSPVFVTPETNTLTFNGSSSGSAVVSVQAAAGSVSFVLPNTNGIVGDSLITDGAGTTSWGTSASNLAVKQPVTVATTANITLSGEQTIDGVLTSASRVLVKDQSSGSQNGIYISGAGTWSRASDWSATGQVASGTAVFVIQGSQNGSATFKVSNVGSITIGTTAVTFTSAQNVIGNDKYLYGGQPIAFAQNTYDNYYFANAGNTTATGLDNLCIGPFTCLNLDIGTHNTLLSAQSGREITSGQSISCGGYDSCASLTTGSYVAGWGVNACRDGVTSSYVVCIGVETFLKNLADFNTGIGNAAGYNNTTGTRNSYGGAGAGHGDLNDVLDSTNSYASCWGADACGQIRSGDYISANGYQSQFNNVSSPSNTSDGAESSLNLVSGTGENVTVGRGAGRGATGATYYQNAFGGMNSGYAADTAHQNAAWGHSSLIGCTSCSGIFAGGYFAAQTLTTATNSTILGQQVGSTTFATGSNVILLGTSANVDTPLASTSNFMNLGSVIFATGITGTVASPAGKVGIKIAAPSNDLDVAGTIGATGQIVSTLATGTAPFSVASTTLVPNLYVARAVLADTATTATTATNGATVAVSNNANYYPMLAASSSNSNQPFNLSSGLTFNPSTGTLSATIGSFGTLGASGVASFTNTTNATALGGGAVNLSGGLTVASGKQTLFGGNVGIGATGTLSYGLELVNAAGFHTYSGTYDANLVFGNGAGFRSGIRVHDNSAAELRLWHEYVNGQIYIATGYNGDQSNVLPTAGLMVGAGNVVSVLTTTAATSASTGSFTSVGGISSQGAIWAGTYVAITPTVVNSLPTCNSGLDGARAYVTNNNTAASFQGAVTTGGSNRTPVYCDGNASAWKQG